MAKCLALALIGLIALAAMMPAVVAVESVPIPANVNCNRSCWNYPGLVGLKQTLFTLCHANAQILDKTPGKYGCKTFIYYRFKTNKELVAFQNCQSTQKLYLDKVFNPGYKITLTNPPKYSRC